MTQINTLFDVSGKVAIVTGGSRGIGAMIAQGLVENGVRTYISSRTESECLATAEALSEFGDCTAIPADLSSQDGIKKFLAAFTERESRLDILINNAGIVESATYEEMTEPTWERVMDINLKSLFFLTQKLTGLLQKNASVECPARIINIASVVGVNIPGEDTMFAYASSKSAVIHLTRHLAKRLTKNHITVNAISPALFPNRRTEEFLKPEYSPMGRLGRPDDIAGTVIFLASRAGSWITGVNIPVDGGCLLQ